ncbi:hypothetical protein [Limosilactobacillus antri]|uniref:hypothetical protein n=1 Tax=Limosilactobacillus antri TaxID=227943 RepID=UPI001F57BA4D|nr:hypothetical protein [Limosilactobacillus antri]
MTTKELIEKLKPILEIEDVTIGENDEIHVWIGGMISLLIPNNAKTWFEISNYEKVTAGAFNDAERVYVSSLINQFLSTPLEDREAKYRVRLRGFNSENGHQYLTAQDDNVRATRFFACAEKPDLKQEFTQDELNVIANRNQFKGVGWLQDLIRHAELVEDD